METSIVSMAIESFVKQGPAGVLMLAIVYGGWTLLKRQLAMADALGDKHALAQKELRETFEKTIDKMVAGIGSRLDHIDERLDHMDRGGDWPESARRLPPGAFTDSPGPKKVG